jgi:hypothetical protein
MRRSIGAITFLVLMSGWAGPWAAHAQVPIGRQAAPVARTTVAGTVRDEAGQPVPEAEVSAGSVSVSTGADGAFTLAGIPVGLVTVNVRRIGFNPSVTQWDVDTAGLHIDLRLARVPTTLAAVRVVARAQPFEARLAGFYERESKKLGYYITRDDIARKNSTRMADMLIGIPGIRLVTMSGAMGQKIQLRGGRCEPLVVLDGFPATSGSFDVNMIDMGTVEGVEVYPNANSVPAELMAVGNLSACGVVAIWTSPMRPNRRASAERADGTANIAQLIASGAVYLPGAVDVQASLMSGTAAAVFPPALLRDTVATSVTARFVVDTNGLVEPKTVGFTTRVGAELAQSIRDALAHAVFTPARLHGDRVPQVVELPFEFDPARAPERTEAGSHGSHEGAGGAVSLPVHPAETPDHVT